MPSDVAIQIPATAQSQTQSADSSTGADFTIAANVNTVLITVSNADVYVSVGGTAASVDASGATHDFLFPNGTYLEPLRINSATTIGVKTASGTASVTIQPATGKRW